MKTVCMLWTSSVAFKKLKLDIDFPAFVCFKGTRDMSDIAFIHGTPLKFFLESNSFNT